LLEFLRDHDKLMVTMTFWRYHTQDQIQLLDNCYYLFKILLLCKLLSVTY